MNEKESRYLCVGCVAFCVVAIPMMLAFSLRSEPPIEIYGDEQQVPTVRRTPLAPPPEQPLPGTSGNGRMSERHDVYLASLPSIDRTLQSNTRAIHDIDVELIEERSTIGLELKLRISNRSPELLNLVTVAFDYLGENRNYLGSGETSCFYLAPGESKIVTAFHSDTFATRIRDYELKLSKVIANGNQSTRDFRIRLQPELPCG